MECNMDTDKQEKRGRFLLLFVSLFSCADLVPSPMLAVMKAIGESGDTSPRRVEVSLAHAGV
jgi:hypothetical protein